MYTLVQAAARELKRSTKVSDNKIKSIPKLEDANLAGTRRAHECTLIVTEGDSAKALAVAGLAVVGRDRYAARLPILPASAHILPYTHACIHCSFSP